jgi:hypothetical protein
MPQKGNGPTKVSQVQLERVCRMYLTDLEAAKALGIGRLKLLALCKHHGVMRPYIRRKIP